MALSKTLPIRTQKKSLRANPHLIVGTPGTILKHIELKTLNLSKVQIVGLDEVDALYDRKFVDQSKKLKQYALNSFRKKAPFHQTQFISSTSTLNEINLKYLQEEFPHAYPIITRQHQKQSENLSTRFLELRGRDKKQSLLGLIEEERETSKTKGTPFPKTIIFTNTLKSCMAFKEFLSGNSIETVALNHSIDKKERISNFEGWKSGGCNILVATDVACRGIDTSCEHVILADFPTTSTEYIHRVGRTARLGGNGRVTALLNNSDVSFAKKIQHRQKNDMSLEGLFSERPMAQNMKKIFHNKKSDHTSEFASKTAKEKGKRILSKTKFENKNDSAVTNAKTGLEWHYSPGKGRRIKDLVNVKKEKKKSFIKSTAKNTKRKFVNNFVKEEKKGNLYNKDKKTDFRKSFRKNDDKNKKFAKSPTDKVESRNFLKRDKDNKRNKFINKNDNKTIIREKRNDNNNRNRFAKKRVMKTN